MLRQVKVAYVGDFPLPEQILDRIVVYSLHINETHQIGNPESCVEALELVTVAIDMEISLSCQKIYL